MTRSTLSEKINQNIVLSCFNDSTALRFNCFMGMRRGLVLMLLVSLLLSLPSRSELDFNSSDSSLAFHVADLGHGHNDSRRIPSAPPGDHKDQHGCYHSHAPFIAVKAAFDCYTASILFVPDVSEVLYSFAPTNILHPPRA